MFFWKIPIKIKISPTKPLVPGKPNAANVKIVNITANLGVIFTKPPYDEINLE